MSKRTGFAVEEKTTLSQGTYTVFFLTHTSEDKTKKIGHVIVPIELALEFASHFED